MGVAASIVLGLILVLAGAGKISQQTIFTFPEAFLPEDLARIVSHSLPPVELVIGSLLIIGVAAKLMVVFAFVLIAAFIANNCWLLGRGLGYESCGCFGVLDTLFFGGLSTRGALYLDIGMLALALIIIFFYPGRPTTGRPWFMRIGRC